MAEGNNDRKPERVPWLLDKLTNVGINLLFTASFSVAATLAAIQTGIVDLGEEALPEMQRMIEVRLTQIDNSIERLDTFTDLSTIQTIVQDNKLLLSELDRSLHHVGRRMDFNQEHSDRLKLQLDSQSRKIRDDLDLRTDRVKRVLESKLERLRIDQDDNQYAVMEALRNLTDERQADRLAMERLFDNLVSSGERAIENKDAHAILQWMDQALYIIASLDILEQDGLFVDRSIAKTRLKRAVDRFRGHQDVDKGHEDVGTVMTIVRAVRELARTGRV